MFGTETETADRLYSLSGGLDGVRETVYLMSRLVKQDSRNPRIIELARKLVGPVPQKFYWGEVERIFRFVRDQIRYVQDPEDTETLLDSERLLNMGSGDCDDKAVLLASLLKAINHQTRFVVVGESPNAPCHVYVETRIGADWVALDPTEKHNMGWYPEGYARVFQVNN